MVWSRRCVWKSVEILCKRTVCHLSLQFPGLHRLTQNSYYYGGGGGGGVTVSPVSKTSDPASLNDFRLVPLTSLALKCSEKILKDWSLEADRAPFGPSSVAYRYGKGGGCHTDHSKPNPQTSRKRKIPCQNSVC